MGIIGKLLKTTIDVAILPLSVAGDVINAPAILDGEESCTSRHLKAVGKDLAKIYDEVEKL